MLERKELPDDVQCDMHMFRAGGCWSVPASYIKFHRELATETIEQMKADGIIIHSAKMVGDGWFDGMRVLQAVVEVSGGHLFKIEWCDSNQGFMVCSPSGGKCAPTCEHEKALKPYFSRKRT